MPLRLTVSFESGGPLDRIDEKLGQIVDILSQMQEVEDFTDEDEQVKEGTQKLEEAKDRIPHGT